MNRFVMEGFGLVATDLVLVAIALWGFDSAAARFVVFCGMAGFTIPTVFRLVAMRRRGKPQETRP